MIGIFDSGIGGLTVLKAIQHKLPQYQLMYLGDTARLPYGNRSQEAIYKFTTQALGFLFQQGCGLVIVACNTASAEALRKIQREWLLKHYPDRKVLGVIIPLAEKAAELSRFGRVGVVGTRATIKSDTYLKELRKLEPDIEVYAVATPILVPLVEEGMINRPETSKIIRNYVRELKNKKVDTLILGCTHYPLLYQQFKKIMGKSCNVLDAPRIIADSLADYLVRHPDIESKLTKGGNHKYFVTDVTDTFEANAVKWLGHKIVLEKVTLQ
ncbi:MAG: glutamate racemase [Candidatus Buchananbacteria bacterium CG10_big_fil_rev_8_21_14_0_10_42_9]|uniref:Glutamate racemase n=1 Tax=Candidatus Buchananbacteria bacterium CG10_big_fil_rev_8_21_14_0_10_42_9 TaxID=1974526 RepID=A0A2H0W1F0_9BACT|nr:MAG: glutamate racemase [Candidatus Buchananbacteria bacterium CG10_big_fil_rev_8_21_14_0_10_42_9]